MTAPTFTTRPTTEQLHHYAGRHSIDIDLVLANPHHRLTLIQHGRKRPDYLLRLTRIGRSVIDEYRLLETKGSINSATALSNQIGKAMTQLSSISLLGNGHVPGIVVANVANATSLMCYAFSNMGPSVAPGAPQPPNRGPSAPHDAGAPVDPGHEFDLDRAKREIQNDPESGGIRASLDHVADAAAAVDVGTLASYAGLFDVAADWLPKGAKHQVLGTHAEHQGGADVLARKVGVIDAVGHEATLPVPGMSAKLRVFRGVTEAVATAMHSGTVEKGSHAHLAKIRSAQDEAMKRPRQQAAGDSADARLAAAVAADGGVLAVEIVDS